jgi:hypothetical protein
MKKKRKNLPKALKRELLREAGWRCAVPTCRMAGDFLEFAHVIPFRDGGEDTFINMIALCPTCHTRFDSKKEEFMDQKELVILKQNLILLNERYSSFEKRTLEYFLENGKDNVLCWGRDLDLMYLLKDGLIVESGTKCNNSINFPPKIYLLTEKGKEFVEKWKTVKSLDPNQN